MSTYLDWRSHPPRSAERILSNMFYTLSPRWYPVNIINSTTYDVLMMYADQLSSASIEAQSVLFDTFLNTVRTVPVGQSNTARIYDNFGYQLGVTKFSTQNYETYNTTYDTQAYRQELRFLIDAYFAPTTQQAVARVGQAFTGMAPIVLEPAVNYDGWMLYSQSGSVVAQYDASIISDRHIPGFGTIIPCDLPFAAAETFIISYSKLGVNTVLRDSYYQNSGALVYVYARDSVSSNTSFQDTVESQIGNVLRADARPLYTYSSRYTYTRTEPDSTATALTLPSTGTSVDPLDGGGGAIYDEWSNPGWITANDGAWAVSSGKDYTEYLIGSAFGFAVPEGAQIAGIQATAYVRNLTLTTNWKFMTVKLVVNGNVVGSNLSDGSYVNTLTGTLFSFGGSSSLWGLNLTAEDINSSNFGLALQFESDVDNSYTVQVNYVQLRIYYYLNPTGFEYTDGGFLTNSEKTAASGSIITGNVLTLPGNAAEDDWYYDWAIFTRNDASYEMAIRQYSSESIPSTVYYKPVVPHTYVAQYLPNTSGSVRAHYVFNSPDRLDDISGYGNNLIYHAAASATTPTYMPSRNEQRVGLTYVGGGAGDLIVYSGSVGPSSNLINSFSFEAWVRGADKYANGFIYFKRDTSNDFNPGVVGDGYEFRIDFGNNRLYFEVNGASKTQSWTSFDITNEDPQRYHYFGITFCSGSVLWYVDDRHIGTTTGATTPSSQSSSKLYLGWYSTAVNANYDVGMDEVRLTDTFLTPEQARQNFYSTKPVISRLGLPSGSIVQSLASVSPTLVTAADQVEYTDGIAWANVNQILIENDVSFTSAALAAGEGTDYLLATDFGFSIPTDAVISGVTVQVRQQSVSDGALRDNRIFLFYQGTPIGDNQAENVVVDVDIETMTRSGDGYTWGATLTPTIVNEADFGVGIRYTSAEGDTARVYWVKMGISYTVPSTNYFHQPQVTVWASGSLEFEYHQFSIRGLKTPQGYVYDRKTTDLLRVPIFASGSL